jgi:hypothetical protein
MWWDSRSLGIGGTTAEIVSRTVAVEGLLSLQEDILIKVMIRGTTLTIKIYFFQCPDTKIQQSKRYGRNSETTVNAITGMVNKTKDVKILVNLLKNAVLRIRCLFDPWIRGG